MSTDEMIGHLTEVMNDKDDLYPWEARAIAAKLRSMEVQIKAADALARAADITVVSLFLGICGRERLIEKLKAYYAAGKGE